MSTFPAPGNQPHLEWLRNVVNAIPYARTSGMRLTHISEAHASMSAPGHEHWTGHVRKQLVHPGVLTALADSACGMAVAAAVGTPEPIATLDLRMDYLRPVAAGRELVCHAHCHRLTRSVAFVRGEIMQEGQSEALATMNAAFMRGTASAPRGATSLAESAARQMDAARQPPPQTGLPPLDSMAPALPLGLSPYVDYLAVRKGVLPGEAPVFQLPFKDELIGNPLLPALHGGVLAGFAETAMVLHLTETLGLPGVEPARGIDFSIDYLRSARPVDTFVQAQTVRQGSRVALVQATVWQDDAQRPIATARGHFLLPQT